MIRESTTIVTLVLILVAIGILMVYSASGFRHPSADGSTLTVVWKQLTLVGIGTALMVLAARFDYHLLTRRWVLWPIVGLTLALLVAVLFIGIDVNGSRRWLAWGAWTFQPSELAKLAMVMFLAVKLVESHDEIDTFKRGSLPPAIIIGLFAVLVLAERDLGTPVVIACVGGLMYLMAGGRWLYAAAGLVPAGAAFYGLCLLFPHRMARLIAFRDPWQYQDAEGFQLIQSLTAFARGALWGQGPGAGEQKLDYLYAAPSDFIFAVWGEEMGLVGSLVLVAMFIALLVVSMRVAMCAPDLLGALLASGITALIAVQAAVNMAVVTGLLPTKGLPLPFISAGGSALIVNMAMVGILVNVGLQAVEPERPGRLATVE